MRFHLSRPIHLEVFMALRRRFCQRFWRTLHR